MLNAIQGIGAGGSRASETSLVAKGNAALYSCFAVFGIFSGSVINTIGPKIPLMLYVPLEENNEGETDDQGEELVTPSISVHYGVWQKVDLMDSSLPLALYSVQQPPYSVCLPLHVVHRWCIDLERR